MLQPLLTVILVIIGVCSSRIVLGNEGIFVFAVVAAFVVYVRLDKSTWPESARRAVDVFWMGVGAILCLSVMTPGRDVAFRVACADNLKQVWLALRSYEDRYGCLPPPCVYDSNGRAVHSWRVLVLPFLDCEALYEEYDFSEPWDGPNNARLLRKRPGVYACPADSTCDRFDSRRTSYVAVVGPKAGWQRDKRTRLNSADLREKASSTILVVETSNSDIQWTEPRDLRFDDLESLQSESALFGRGPHAIVTDWFHHKRPVGANALLANGHVELVPPGGLAVDSLKALLTFGGVTQENVAKVYARSSGYEKPEVNWANCFAIPASIAAAGLLLLQAVWRPKVR